MNKIEKQLQLQLALQKLEDTNKIIYALENKYIVMAVESNDSNEITFLEPLSLKLKRIIIIEYKEYAVSLQATVEDLIGNYAKGETE